MRSLIFIVGISVFLGLIQPSAYAYKIITKDAGAYVFKDGKFKADPNRYKGIYEVDEAAGTLTGISEIDMRTGEDWKGGVYQLLSQPTMKMFQQGNPLKAVRINPKIATVAVITFNEGKFFYVKTTDQYVNIFYGTYEIDF